VYLCILSVLQARGTSHYTQTKVLKRCLCQVSPVALNSSVEGSKGTKDVGKGMEEKQYATESRGTDFQHQNPGLGEHSLGVKPTGQRRHWGGGESVNIKWANPFNMEKWGCYLTGGENLKTGFPGEKKGGTKKKISGNFHTCESARGIDRDTISATWRLTKTNSQHRE